MPTRNIVLTDRQQGFIDSLLKSGRYQNASEVLRDGLRLVEDRETRNLVKLDALRKAAQIGWDDVSAGRYIDVDDTDLDEFVSALGRDQQQEAAA